MSRTRPRRSVPTGGTVRGNSHPGDDRALQTGSDVRTGTTGVREPKNQTSSRVGDVTCCVCVVSDGTRTTTTESTRTDRFFSIRATSVHHTVGGPYARQTNPTTPQGSHSDVYPRTDDRCSVQP